MEGQGDLDPLVLEGGKSNIRGLDLGRGVKKIRGLCEYCTLGVMRP